MHSHRQGPAVTLTLALVRTQVRWRSAVESWTDRLNNSVGDVLLATTCVSYIGPFTKPFRRELWRTTWAPAIMARIPMSHDADPLEILVQPLTIAAWKNSGLPVSCITQISCPIENIFLCAFGSSLTFNDSH